MLYKLLSSRLTRWRSTFVNGGFSTYYFSGLESPSRVFVIPPSISSAHQVYFVRGGGSWFNYVSLFLAKFIYFENTELLPLCKSSHFNFGKCVDISLYRNSFCAIFVFIMFIYAIKTERVHFSFQFKDDKQLISLVIMMILPLVLPFFYTLVLSPKASKHAHLTLPIQLSKQPFQYSRYIFWFVLWPHSM